MPYEATFKGVNLIILYQRRTIILIVAVISTMSSEDDSKSKEILPNHKSTQEIRTHSPMFFAQFSNQLATTSPIWRVSIGDGFC